MGRRRSLVDLCSVLREHRTTRRGLRAFPRGVSPAGRRHLSTSRLPGLAPGSPAAPVGPGPSARSGAGRHPARRDPPYRQRPRRPFGGRPLVRSDEAGSLRLRFDGLLENSIASTSIFVLQATKSQRWMPWRLKPMKDVGGCEKPRGAADQASIRGCPNGETHYPSWGSTPA